MKGDFQWSPELQSYILGSSFLCYIIALPFLSKLAEMFGGKNMLLCCIFFPSFFTFVSPFAARWSVYALIAVQILRGICQVSKNKSNFSISLMPALNRQIFHAIYIYINYVFVFKYVCTYSCMQML